MGPHADGGHNPRRGRPAQRREANEAGPGSGGGAAPAPLSAHLRGAEPRPHLPREEGLQPAARRAEIPPASRRHLGPPRRHQGGWGTPPPGGSSALGAGRQAAALVREKSASKHQLGTASPLTAFITVMGGGALREASAQAARRITAVKLSLLPFRRTTAPPLLDGRGGGGWKRRIAAVQKRCLHLHHLGGKAVDLPRPSRE